MNTPKLSISIATAILGAGKSRRMGSQKLLLPWGDGSVLEHLLSQWQKLGSAQIAVVCPERNQPVQSELDRLGFPDQERIINPFPERGMFESIQCAARWPGWKSGLTHWAFVLGDQPHLRLEMLTELLNFCAANPGRTCQPRQGGHRRHPILLPNAIFEQLAESTATDLKEFLAGYPAAAAYYDSDDPRLALDLDSPADYEQALGLYGPEADNRSK